MDSRVKNEGRTEFLKGTGEGIGVTIGVTCASVGLGVALGLATRKWLGLDE